MKEVIHTIERDTSCPGVSDVRVVEVMQQFTLDEVWQQSEDGVQLISEEIENCR